MKHAQLSLERQLTTLFELVLVVTAGVVMYDSIKNLEDNNIFTGKFHARDVGLILDALAAVPDAVFLHYFLAKPLSVSIDQKGTVEVAGQSYFYAPAKDTSLLGAYPEVAQLFFYKEGRHIRVASEQTASNRLALDCPSEVHLQTPVVLDPAQGFSSQSQFQGSTGKAGVGSSLSEAELTAQIAARVSTQLTSTLSAVQITRSVRVPEAKTVKDRLDSIPEKATLVGIGIGSSSPDQNVLRMFIDGTDVLSDRFKQSYALACALNNALTNEFKATGLQPFMTGSAIIPVIPARLINDDPETVNDEADVRTVLQKPSLGVYIEIGNMQKPNDPVLQQYSKIADVIAQVLGTKVSS